MTREPSSRRGPRFTWRAIPAVLLFVVVIPLVVFGVGKWVDWLVNFPLFPPFPLNWIVGTVMLVIGYVLCWGSIYQLYRAGLGLPWGPVDKEAESTSLVTTGLYAYTRNPMILGFLFLLSGIGWLVQSITAIIVMPFIVFILLYCWLKLREEARLEQRFGEAYSVYKKRTPLIFPRPWRRPKTSIEAEEES